MLICIRNFDDHMEVINSYGSYDIHFEVAMFICKSSCSFGSYDGHFEVVFVWKIRCSFGNCDILLEDVMLSLKF